MIYVIIIYLIIIFFSYGESFNGKLINFVYKKCYETCSSCFGEGNDKENKCIDCKDSYVKYPYDSTKCNIDTNDCDKFWQVNESTNNIECVQTCSGYIIHKNLYEPQIIKPQCVQNCQTIFNPLEIGNPNSLLFYACDFQKYCLNLEFCQLKNLEYDDKECFRPLECFDIDDYSKVENSTIV